MIEENIVAPLELTAMTLRGLGSYLHGARIEITPLTILCGKNGSGKSTWLKFLNLLQRSNRDSRLPFAFDEPDSNPAAIRHTNAFVHIADEEEVSTLAGADGEEEAFGPLGTVGLEFTAATGFTLSVSNKDYCPGSTLADLFWRGLCLKGATFRVRLCHPTYWNDYIDLPQLRHLIELQIDDTVCLRMTSPRDPLQKFITHSRYPRRTKPYLFACSPSLLFPSIGTSLDLVDAGSVEFHPDLHVTSLVDCDPSLVHSTVIQAIDLLTILLDRVLNGYFYISPIRLPHEYGSPPEERTFYVGAQGEFAWAIQRIFSHWLMIQLSPVDFVPSDISVSACQHIFSPTIRNNSPKVHRLWEMFSAEDKQALSALVSPHITSNEWSDKLANALNSLMTSDNLFDKNIWGQPWIADLDDDEDEDDEDEDDEDEDDEDDDGEDEEDREDEALNYKYDDQILQRLAPRYPSIPAFDKALLNRYLIERTLTDTPFNKQPGLLTRRYYFDEYVCYWTSQLTGTRFDIWKKLTKDTTILDRRVRLVAEVPWDRRFVPTGFFLGDRDAMRSTSTPKEEDRSILVTNCFGTTIGQTQEPEQVSSGFHQLLPIITQLGLMRRGETLGIEDPEVHLHPSLQLDVAGMLLAHSVTGRRIIVETHSDLLIRRVIRAILEEEVPQEATRIYFVDTARTHVLSVGGLTDQIAYSSIAPLRVNEEGQIDNWPEGFLDDDVNESQRLIDVMYGRMRGPSKHGDKY